MSYVKVAEPVLNEPVSLSEAKMHLRLTDLEEHSAEDLLILSLITAAREYCESITGRALAAQTLETRLDGFPRCYEIELPRPPLQSVISVTYKSSDGTETELRENTDYIVDSDSNVGRIVLPYGASWPVFTPYRANPVKIRYIAGYTDQNPIPKTIKQAMLLLIGYWFENREAALTESGASVQIEFAVKALLNLHKVWWL
jgi:uncharacterized phiE125 gp8 family phage protein